MDKYEKPNETFDVEPIEVKKEIKSVEKQITKFETPTRIFVKTTNIPGVIYIHH